LNSNYFIDDVTLENISSVVRNEMNRVFSGELETNLQNQSENLKDLANWYAKAQKGRDNLFSEIANDIVEKLLEKLPQRYIRLAIENIDINTEEEKPNVKFDATYKLDPIKPFVEFKIRVGGKQVHSERARFEINSNGGFKEMEIKIENGKKKVCLGTLEANFEILLVGLPFVKLEEPKSLVSKKISVDLSKDCVNNGPKVKP